MGVLNITPDSFSDGGQFNSVESALAHATQLVAEGASVLDIGGESTRPGAARLTEAQEQARVLPVIEELSRLPEVAGGSVALSIDTLNASTAKLAVAAGVSIVNDVSGGQADPQMFAEVAELMLNRSSSGKPITYVLGHWANFAEGAGAVQQTADIVSSVVAELAERVAIAEAAGLKRNQIVLDPGLGFGKTLEHNLELIRGIPRLIGLGSPLLMGHSRKSFLGMIPYLGATPGNRLSAAAVLTGLMRERGARIFRVHEATPHCDSLRATEALLFP
jgi:dihydropteroate synthase